MKTDLTYGKKQWAFSGGCIPSCSTGKEPEFTSHDKIAVLNCTLRDAHIVITIFFENDEAVIYKEIVVEASRLRKIRFNDLINPFPISLDNPYAFTVRADVEVIVQFSRINTSQSGAGFCVTPFSIQDR